MHGREIQKAVICLRNWGLSLIWNAEKKKVNVIFEIQHGESNAFIAYCVVTDCVA